jgi:hypothetical protein
VQRGSTPTRTTEETMQMMERLLSAVVFSVALPALAQTGLR